jgi:hypothetical protein
LFGLKGAWSLWNILMGGGGSDFESMGTSALATVSRPALRPTQPLVRESFPEGKERPKRDDDHSPISNAEIKMSRSYTSSPWHLHGGIGQLYFITSTFLFVFVDFFGAFSVTDCVESNGRVTSEWWTEKYLEWSGRGPILRYFRSIRLEGLEKTTKTLSGEPVSGPRFEPGTSEYEAGISNTRPRRSV